MANPMHRRTRERAEVLVVGEELARGGATHAACLAVGAGPKVVHVDGEGAVLLAVGFLPRASFEAVLRNPAPMPSALVGIAHAIPLIPPELGFDNRLQRIRKAIAHKASANSERRQFLTRVCGLQRQRHMASHPD